MVGDKKIKFFEGWRFKNWGQAIGTVALMVGAIIGSFALLVWLFIVTM